MADLIYKDEAYAIIGAAFEVHKHLGCGFLEAVYQEALGKELQERNIPYEAFKSLPIYYHGIRLEKEYVADLVVYGKIIVELKAVTSLLGLHAAQLINYLKATNLKLGLLINFGDRSLVFKRIINKEGEISVN